MHGDGPGQLRMAGFADERRTGITVAEHAQPVIVGQRLVDVVQEGRGLDGTAIDVEAGVAGPTCEEGGHLGHDGHMPDESR